MNSHEPRVGTGTTGPGEAVFAIRSDGKPHLFMNNVEKQNLKILKIQFSHSNSLNFPSLVAKTASPGPVVPVPTLGSWKFRFWRTPQKEKG